MSWVDSISKSLSEAVTKAVQKAEDGIDHLKKGNDSPQPSNEPTTPPTTPTVSEKVPVAQDPKSKVEELTKALAQKEKQLATKNTYILDLQTEINTLKSNASSEADPLGVHPLMASPPPAPTESQFVIAAEAKLNALAKDHETMKLKTTQAAQAAKTQYDTLLDKFNKLEITSKQALQEKTELEIKQQKLTKENEAYQIQSKKANAQLESTTAKLNQYESIVAHLKNASAQASESQESNSILKSENEGLRKQVEDGTVRYQALLKQAKLEIKNASTKVTQEYTSKLEDKSSEIEVLKSSVTQLNSALSTLQESVEKREQEYIASLEALRSQVAEQRSGDGDSTKALLQQVISLQSQLQSDNTKHNMEVQALQKKLTAESEATKLEQSHHETTRVKYTQLQEQVADLELQLEQKDSECSHLQNQLAYLNHPQVAAELESQARIQELTARLAEIEDVSQKYKDALEIQQKQQIELDGIRVLVKDREKVIKNLQSPKPESKTPQSPLQDDLEHTKPISAPHTPKPASNPNLPLTPSNAFGDKAEALTSKEIVDQLKKEKSVLETKVVELTIANQKLTTNLTELTSRVNIDEDLSSKYKVSLDLLKERSEDLDRLKQDTQEWKQLYKNQIIELCDQIEALKRGGN